MRGFATLSLLGGAALWCAIALIPAHSAVAGSTATQRGAELFATTGCVHCHGAAGVGGGIGPDLQLIRKRMPADAMATQIRNGGQAMPAFGDQLNAEQIGSLVAYLRAKRPLIKVPAAPTAAMPAQTPPKDPD